MNILILDTVSSFLVFLKLSMLNFLKFDNVLVPKFRFINDSLQHFHFPKFALLVFFVTLASDLFLCASISPPEIGKKRKKKKSDFSLPHRDVVRIDVFMEERNYIKFLGIIFLLLLLNRYRKLQQQKNCFQLCYIY